MSGRGYAHRGITGVGGVSGGWRESGGFQEGGCVSSVEGVSQTPDTPRPLG